MRRIDGWPLWIGTSRDARDTKGVLDAGVEAVVDLAMLCEPVKPPRELVYLRFPLVDGEGNARWVVSVAVRAVADLLRHGVPTLVACDGGMSRSLAVSALALSSVSPLTAPDAFLRQLASTGPADVHPTLWADVVRSIEPVNESRYQRRD